MFSHRGTRSGAERPGSEGHLFPGAASGRFGSAKMALSGYKGRDPLGARGEGEAAETEEHRVDTFRFFEVEGLGRVGWGIRFFSVCLYFFGWGG